VTLLSTSLQRDDTVLMSDSLEGLGFRGLRIPIVIAGGATQSRALAPAPEQVAVDCRVAALLAMTP